MSARKPRRREPEADIRVVYLVVVRRTGTVLAAKLSRYDARACRNRLVPETGKVVRCEVVETTRAGGGA